MFHLASQILPKDIFCKVHPEKRKFKKIFLKLTLNLSLIFEVKVKANLKLKIKFKILKLAFSSFFQQKATFYDAS